MTSSERMTCLIDHDVGNGLYPMAYIPVLPWFQCWQAVSGFLSA